MRCPRFCPRFFHDITLGELFRFVVMAISMTCGIIGTGWCLSQIPIGWFFLYTLLVLGAFLGLAEMLKRRDEAAKRSEATHNGSKKD